MENTKFNFFIFILFLILAGIIYWSVSTINTGVNYTNKENISEEEIIEGEIEKVLNSEEIVIKESVIGKIEEEEIVEKENTKYLDLIKNIKKLIDDVIYMKKGSQGTRVGIIQNFLNIYNDTKSIIDNDYGNKTADLIKKFQVDQGLGVDGQAGPNTYKKMILWLENN